MQTIILAGGEGTRLRPMTSDVPKPLIKVAGKSAIERLLERLGGFGIRSATVCTHYLADRLEEALGKKRSGVSLKYCREEYPLGTAGCVRLAWNKDDVLVLSGDGVCGFDYSAITEFHQKNSADVTIVAKEVDDPREYGLMTVDESGRITGFLEKPGYDKCITNLANTGVYVVSKDVISRIPEGEKVDFAADVFPKLLEEGKKLYAYVETGYWCDIGDIPSLLKCQTELLEGANLISRSASLGKDCGVYGGTVVEDGAAVGASSRIMSSLISENACIASGADISEAVICRNVTAGEELIMKKYSVLGEGCVVGRGVTVEAGARVAPRTRLPDGAIVRTDVAAGGFSTLTFGEGGEALGLKTQEEYLRFGMAAGSALNVEAVAVGGRGESFEALCLGFRAAGVDVYSLHGAGFGETVFCARKLDCGFAAYVDDGIRLFSSAFLDLGRAAERKIEQNFSRPSLVAKRPARLIDGAAASALYLKHLKSVMPENPLIRPIIRTDSAREADIFSEISGRGEGGEVTFCVASDRVTVSALTESAVVPYEELLLICCKANFAKKRSVVLPDRAPMSCEKLASQYRSSVIRASSGKRELSMFCCDGLELIAEITAYLTDRAISLEAAAEELPKIVYTKRVVDMPGGLPKIMSESFSGTKVGSDVAVESGGARALIRPLKSGRAVSLYIESVSTEAAAELSADIVARLRKESR